MKSIKRPIFISFLAFVFGEFIAETNLYSGIRIGIIITSIVFIVGYTIITKQQVSFLVVIFLFLVMGLVITKSEQATRDEIYSIEDGNVKVSGIVAKITETKMGYGIYLRKSKFDAGKNENIIVYAEDVSKIKIGNVIEVRGDFEQFENARNQGNFDSRKYYESLGIYGKLSANKIVVIDKRVNIFKENIRQLKSFIEKRLDDICNKNKWNLEILKNKNSMYEAILLGDKNNLDTEIKDLYAFSGIAHVLAISGLHISIIGIFIYNSLRRKFKFFVSAFFSIIVVFLFGFLSGMAVATIRAMVMFALRLIGDAIGRNYDGLTSMSLAGILLLINNPFIIYNSGFQMSFAAIFSIIIVWKKIEYVFQFKEKIRNLDKNKENDNVISKKDRRINKLKKVKYKCESSLMFSAVVSIFMSPIVAYNYYSLPTYGFLLNLIIIPLMNIVVISGIVGIMFSLITTTLGVVGIMPGALVLEFYEKLCDLMADVPFSNITVGKPEVWLIVCIYILFLIGVCWLEKRRKQFEREEKVLRKTVPLGGITMIEKLNIERNRRVKELQLYSVFLLQIVLFQVVIYGYYPVKNNIVNSRKLNISMLDVGQGDGIFLRMPNNTTMLIDGGSTTVKNVAKNRIVPTIQSRGHGTIDYVVVTHCDEDHVNGINELLNSSIKKLKIKNIILPDIYLKDEKYMSVVNSAENNKINVLYITKGNSLKIGNVKFTCLSPGTEYINDDRNDYSTVLRLEYHQFSMVFTGDISGEIEEKILEDKLVVNNIRACVALKVAHHGSKYSTTDRWLEKIKPTYSFISVGKNNMYGHPTRETLDRLEQVTSKIFRTDYSGEVDIISDGKEINIIENIKNTDK